MKRGKMLAVASMTTLVLMVGSVDAAPCKLDDIRSIPGVVDCSTATGIDVNKLAQPGNREVVCTNDVCFATVKRAIAAPSTIPKCTYGTRDLVEAIRSLGRDCEERRRLTSAPPPLSTPGPTTNPTTAPPLLPPSPTRTTDSTTSPTTARPVNPSTPTPNDPQPTTLAGNATASSASRASSSSSASSRSAFNDPLIQTSPAPSTQTNEQSSTLMLIVAIGVSIIVLIAIGIAIHLWRQHRAKSTEKKPIEQSTGSSDDARPTPHSLMRRAAFDQLLTPTAAVHHDLYRDHKPLSKSLSVSTGTSEAKEDVAVTMRERSSSLLYDDDLLALQLRVADIEDIKVVGSGGYGIVYLVMYRRTRLLASKRIVPDQVTRRKTMAFIEEIKLVSTLQHPCIVEFVGAAWTTESDLQALFEYMPQGDLLMYLTKQQQQQQQRPVTPSWTREKLQIALDIIDALVYVHSFDPPLVHRDLKSRNVLLSAELRAKLSDFGISRHQSENCSMTTGMGTNRWMAPEVIMGGGDYDQSCDIYSFGVMLTEMDTHMAPFTDLRGMDDSIGQPSDWMLLQMVAVGRLQPTFSESCPSDIEALGKACMTYKRSRRPKTAEVAQTLRQIVARIHPSLVVA